jgi:hypothetical protein
VPASLPQAGSAAQAQALRVSTTGPAHQPAQPCPQLAARSTPCDAACCRAHAGLPNDNSTFFCNYDRSTCWLVIPGSGAAFSTQQAFCQARGGWVVTYQSGEALAAQLGTAATCCLAT